MPSPPSSLKEVQETRARVQRLEMNGRQLRIAVERHMTVTRPRQIPATVYLPSSPILSSLGPLHPVPNQEPQGMTLEVDVQDGPRMRLRGGGSDAGLYSDDDDEYYQPTTAGHRSGRTTPSNTGSFDDPPLARRTSSTMSERGDQPSDHGSYSDLALAASLARSPGRRISIGSDYTGELNASDGEDGDGEVQRAARLSFSNQSPFINRAEASARWVDRQAAIRAGSLVDPSDGVLKKVDGYGGPVPAPSDALRALDQDANKKAQRPSPESISPLSQPFKHDRESSAAYSSSYPSGPHDAKAPVVQQVLDGEQDAMVPGPLAKAAEDHHDIVEDGRDKAVEDLSRATTARDDNRAKAERVGKKNLTEEEVDEIIWERLGGRY